MQPLRLANGHIGTGGAAHHLLQLLHQLAGIRQGLCWQHGVGWHCKIAEVFLGREVGLGLL